MTKTDTCPPRSAITFRTSTDADIPFQRYVYGTTREMEMRMVPWSDQQKVEFLDMQFRAQKTHYEDAYPTCQFLVIELEGKPIGRLFIDRLEDEIRLTDIALLPEYRARGIGRMLIEEILAEGQETGKKVTIYVEHNNPARHLYDRLNFTHVDTNGVYHLMEWKPSPSA